MRIGSIVIHCYKFNEMVAFWQGALGYVPRNEPNNGWVVLVDPNGGTPNLSFQARTEQRSKRSWIHLDLYSDTQEQDVARLIELGAKRYPWRYRPHDDFVVLEDPDGNLFCVVQRPLPTSRERPKLAVAGDHESGFAPSAVPPLF